MIEILGMQQKQNKGVWKKTTADFQLNYHTAPVARNGLLYLLGGENASRSSVYQTIQRFNPITKSLEIVTLVGGYFGKNTFGWSDAANINWVRDPNFNLIYCVRESNLNTVYNAGNLSFTPSDSMIGLPYRNLDIPKFINAIFIINKLGSVKDIYLRDQRLLTSTKVATDIRSKDNAAHTICGDRILIAGGLDSGAASRHFLQYNIITNTLFGSVLPVANYGGVFVTIDSDTVHLIGGSQYPTATNATTLRDILEYKISTGKWTLLQEKFPIDIFHHRVVQDNKRAFIVSPANSPSGEVYYYDF